MEYNYTNLKDYDSSVNKTIRLSFKRFFSVFCLCFLLISFIVPTIISEAATPITTKVTISNKSISLYKGQLYRLTLERANKNVKVKSVKWSTSNKKIVIVNNQGYIKGINKGTAYVYCGVKWTNNKTTTVKCKVMVYNPINLKSFSLDKTTINLKPGGHTTLKTVKKPSNATIVKISYDSSDVKIATVSSTGLVTAKGVGTCKIAVAIKTYNGKIYKKYATVKVWVPLVNISLDKTSVSLHEGESTILTTTFTPSNATYKKLTYTSSDEKVATVNSNGVISAITEGSATITVKSTNGKKATCVVEVLPLEEKEKKFGQVTVKYVDVNTNKEIADSETHKDLELKLYTYEAKEIEEYKIKGDIVKTVELSEDDNIQTVIFEYEKIVEEDVKTYTIELDKYNISNNNTNANETTIGINKALIYAKENDYEKVILPKGHYAIDTSVVNKLELTDGTKKWTQGRKGIIMQSDMELDMTGATLEMVPVEDPYYSILSISGCKNSVITGGTILGDRDEHDYGMRINENGQSFMSGDIDSATGVYKEDESRVVTKDYIEYYEDWFSKKKEDLPTKFFVIPLWNTSMNTVDGGCAYVYCYDKDGKYIGMTTGGNGYIKERTLPEGTAKLKISLRGEKRLDPVIAITKRTVYSTYEFGSCISITASDNIKLNGVTANNSIGDCVTTLAPPIDVTVDNLSFVKCTFENSRRQGISFVATGENYLVKDCYIGNINGTDPQSGIDIEHYDYVKNVVIDGTNFYNNKKLDLINYNGTDIEVKNSNFTTSLGVTYGHTMNIHDNFFGYAKTSDGKEINKGASINLYTKNNKFYNNTVKGGNYANSGEGGETYNNKFIETDAKIFSNGVNKYYNSTVWIQQREGFSLLSGCYFENCSVNGANDSPNIEVRDCEFNDSSFNGRGPCTVKNCVFNLNNKYLMEGWKTNSTDIVFDNCSITSKKSFLGGGNVKLTFKNSNIVTSRDKIIQYGTTTFDSTRIKFTNVGDENNITWNIGGYGYERCPWYFNNCTFESELPITIGGGNVVNPTIIGNVTVK